MSKDRLRLIITFCCLAVSVAAWGETIVLKSGARIAVDAVQEHDGRVQYWVGENTFSIPKSIVARIETGPGASQPAPAEEVPRSSGPMAGTEQLIDRVIRNGAVDTAALKAIELEGIAEQSAAANAIAGNFEQGRSNLAAALRYLESALRFLPNHPILLLNYASVLLRMGRTAEALSFAQRAAAADPHFADAFTLLGYAYYKNDRNRDAIAALKKSLQLHPDERVQQLLDQVQ